MRTKLKKWQILGKGEMEKVKKKKKKEIGGFLGAVSCSICCRVALAVDIANFVVLDRLCSRKGNRRTERERKEGISLRFLLYLNLETAVG
jgi:hypothetical protein